MLNDPICSPTLPCAEGTLSHACALARVAAGGPHDFAGAVLRVDQYHRLGRQSLRRLSSLGGEVAPYGICRVGAGRSWKRAPEKIDAPAGVTRRITGISAELRGAEIPRSAPPSREGPVVILGIEGPDVEVLDAVLPVHVVQGSALAQGPAQETTGISAGAVRIPPEEPGLGLGGQRSESKQVSYFDSRQRPIRIRRQEYLAGYLCPWGLLWFPEPWLGLNFEVSVVGVDRHKEVVQEALEPGQTEWVWPRIAEPDWRIPGEFIGVVGHREADAG